MTGGARVMASGIYEARYSRGGNWNIAHDVPFTS